MSLRTDWTRHEVSALFERPFLELMHQAQSVHRTNFNPNQVQISTLLSIKTGACPEDCGYCSQSGHHNTALMKQKLLPLEEVIERAKQAKASGASRFCMGAAWRSPPASDMPKVVAMIKAVKELGLETCVTLGMLSPEQTAALKDAGLDYYNHNLDTSPEYYKNVVSTRTYDERLTTLDNVREAGINVCCGGIIGMGETREDRVSLLTELATLPTHPQSVPINQLVGIPGTPLGESEALDNFEFIRTIAVARILMPQSMVRLSAGREEMSAEMQAWCFFAGANSIFYGETLLTTSNPVPEKDKALFETLGLEAMPLPATKKSCSEICE
jgi:biotin synthase